MLKTRIKLSSIDIPTLKPGEQGGYLHCVRPARLLQPTDGSQEEGGRLVQVTHKREEFLVGGETRVNAGDWLSCEGTSGSRSHLVQLWPITVAVGQRATQARAELIGL